MRKLLPGTEGLLVMAVLILAFLVRYRMLAERSFWVDEAESSINALSILANGYPGDSFLGLPIYENALSREWPGNPEYAYRDSSYSDKHFAIYHGWLPLYSIAASFAVQHITPPAPGPNLRVQYDLAERKRRTQAARLPAVVFGVALLIVLFIAGALIYGRDAGWAALVVGAFHPYLLAVSTQARYYSAEVLFTTLSCLSLWLLVARGCRWRHVLLAALSFTLLFYTHLLSFCTACLMGLLVSPFVLKQQRAAFFKLFVFAGLVAAATLPWIILTGFYSQQAQVPRAWSYLKMPADLWLYPPFHGTAAALGLALVALSIGLLLARDRLPVWLTEPARQASIPLLFLAAWAACGYALFITCMPLVSFDRARLNLSYWGPALLLAAVFSASLARVCAPRFSRPAAPLVLVLLFFATGHHLFERGGFEQQSWLGDTLLLDRLATLHLQPGTKLFAAPNDHLILTFYSGLPVQDMTPIRSSFLSTYPGPIVYIDRATSVGTGVLDAANIQARAQQLGALLSLAAAERWSMLLRNRDYRQQMLARINPGAPNDDPALPRFAVSLLAEHHAKISEFFSHTSLELMTRGFQVRSWQDWRDVLKYRFVDPAAHSGTHANYLARLRGAQVVFLPECDAAIYISPAPRLEMIPESAAFHRFIPHISAALSQTN